MDVEFDVPGDTDPCFFLHHIIKPTTPTTTNTAIIIPTTAPALKPCNESSPMTFPFEHLLVSEKQILEENGYQIRK